MLKAKRIMAAMLSFVMIFSAAPISEVPVLAKSQPQLIVNYNFEDGLRWFYNNDRDNFDIIKSGTIIVKKEGDQIEGGGRDKVDANGFLYQGTGSSAHYALQQVSNQPTSAYDAERGTVYNLCKTYHVDALVKEQSAGIAGDDPATTALDAALKVGDEVRKEATYKSAITCSNPFAKLDQEGAVLAFWGKASEEKAEAEATPLPEVDLTEGRPFNVKDTTNADVTKDSKGLDHYTFKAINNPDEAYGVEFENLFDNVEEKEKVCETIESALETWKTENNAELFPTGTRASEPTSNHTYFGNYFDVYHGDVTENPFRLENEGKNDPDDPNIPHTQFHRPVWTKGASIGFWFKPSQEVIDSSNTDTPIPIMTMYATNKFAFEMEADGSLCFVDLNNAAWDGNRRLQANQWCHNTFMTKGDSSKVKADAWNYYTITFANDWIQVYINGEELIYTVSGLRRSGMREFNGGFMSKYNPVGLMLEGDDDPNDYIKNNGAGTDKYGNYGGITLKMQTYDEYANTNEQTDNDDASIRATGVYVDGYYAQKEVEEDNYQYTLLLDALTTSGAKFYMGGVPTALIKALGWGIEGSATRRIRYTDHLVPEGIQFADVRFFEDDLTAAQAREAYEKAKARMGEETGEQQPDSDYARNRHKTAFMEFDKDTTAVNFCFDEASGVKAGEWHYYTYVISTDKINAYIDGKPSDFDITADIDGAKPSDLTAFLKEAKLYLGASNLSTVETHEATRLDNVSFYNGSMTADEVASLYEAQMKTTSVDVTRPDKFIGMDSTEDFTNVNDENPAKVKDFNINGHMVKGVAVAENAKMSTKAGIKLSKNPFAGNRLTGASISFWLRNNVRARKAANGNMTLDDSSVLSFIDQPKYVFNPKEESKSQDDITTFNFHTNMAFNFIEGAQTDAFTGNWYAGIVDETASAKYVEDSGEWHFITLNINNNGVTPYYDGEKVEGYFRGEGNRFMDGYYVRERDLTDPVRLNGMFGGDNNQRATMMMAAFAYDDMDMYFGYFPNSMSMTEIGSPIDVTRISCYNAELTDTDVKALYDQEMAYINAQPVYPEGIGDVDGDGEVTAADAQMILQMAAKDRPLPATDAQFIRADVDMNGSITPIDALLILRYYYKLSVFPSFPPKDELYKWNYEYDIKDAEAYYDGENTVVVDVYAKGDLPAYDIGIGYNTDEVTYEESKIASDYIKLCGDNTHITANVLDDKRIGSYCLVTGATVAEKVSNYEGLFASFKFHIENNELPSLQLYTNTAGAAPELIMPEIPIHTEFGFQMEQDNTVTITAGSGNPTEVQIPETVWDMPVIKIGEDAFSHCEELKSVNLPASVVSIGQNAFRYCSNLTDIEIPYGISRIDDCAFDSCSSLENIIIPDSVISIGSYAFGNCSSLTGMDIPKNVNDIGHGAFSGCKKLTAINVDPNNSVYGSVDGVLMNRDQTILIACPGGKEGTYSISKKVTHIWDDAFSECANLTGIEIPKSVTNIGVHAFGGCSSLESIEIPQSVTIIEDYAFSGCSNLTSVIIPDSVMDLGEGILDGSSNVTIYCYSDSLAEQYAIEKDIPYKLLDDDSDVTPEPTVTPTPVPEETPDPADTENPEDTSKPADTENPTDTPKPSETQEPTDTPKPSETQEPTDTPKPDNTPVPSETVSPEHFEISGSEDHTASIDSYTGMETDIVIPEEINGYKTTEISAGAFKDSSVTSIVLPETVTKIGAGAFAGSSLKRITITANEVEIAEDAFDGCENVIICCYSASKAYAFAQAHGIAVELLDEKPDIIYGDLDGSGNADANDALLILKIAAKLQEPTETQSIAGDVDNSGSVDASDALYVLKKAAKLIDVFPIEAN